MEEFLVPLFLFGGLGLVFVGFIMLLVASVAWVGLGIFVTGLLSVLIAIGMMIAY